VCEPHSQLFTDAESTLDFALTASKQLTHSLQNRRLPSLTACAASLLINWIIRCTHGVPCATLLRYLVAFNWITLPYLSGIIQSFLYRLIRLWLKVCTFYAMFLGFHLFELIICFCFLLVIKRFFPIRFGLITQSQFLSSYIIFLR